MEEPPKKTLQDILAPQKSHINLTDPSLPSDFGLDNFRLTKILADVILVEFIDIQSGAGGDYIERNGLAIPINHVLNAWRKGRVILAGNGVRLCEVGDIIVFPSNMGIPITNLEVKDHGRIKNGLFINEERIFGICEHTEE